MSRKAKKCLIITSLIFFTNETILRLPDCGKLHADWTILYPGKYLAGSIYSLVSNISTSQCSVKCMLYPKCKSISVKNDGSLCMLHHSRHGENGTRLEAGNIWTHIETNDQVMNFGPYCETIKPCKHGKCFDTCEEKQYRCECEDKTWKLQAKKVCFGTKNNSFGQFQMSDGGKLRQLKLQHTGEVSMTCDKNCRGTRWGCLAKPNHIYVVVTDKHDKIIMPSSSITAAGKYLLPGFNGTSPYITFSDYNMVVDTGEKFRIWYLDDLFNYYESNNNGSSCADVFAVFCD